MPRIFDALARLVPRRTQTHAETKATRTGPLVAFETLGRPVWTPRDYSTFAREGFMQNAVVYRSVRMIAEAAASVPLLLYEGGREIEDHPLLDLMAKPSADHTGTDFLEAWYGYLLVSGNAYAEAVAVGGEVRELFALRPDRMKVIPGLEGWPEGYEYTAGGQSIRFADEVAPGVRPILHMRLFHPANDHYGMSPIEAAATAIDIHNTASAWNKALLDNSARPSGALVYAANDGRMTAEQFERLKSELETSYTGAKQAGRPLLLEGGLDWKPLALSPKDMDFIEAKNSAAREIALAIGVPPMLLGIPGDNTFSDDPYDPGGPTNLGITLRVYTDWTGQTIEAASLTRLKDELRCIPREMVRDIYRARYWTPAGCHELPPALGLLHFDTAVNHGVGTAIRLLQEAVGSEIDREIGPLTRRALAGADILHVLDRIADLRRKRYRALPHFWRFGRGWLRRVDATLGEARALIAVAETKTINHSSENGESSMTAPATPSAPAVPSKWWGESITVWGALITAVSTVLPVLGPLIGLDITPELVKLMGTQLLAVVQAVTGLLGTIMTLYGRARAIQPLERRPVSLKL